MRNNVSMESDYKTRIHSSCGAAAAAATTTAAHAAALPNTPHSLCLKEGRLRLKGSSNPQRAPHAPVPSRQQRKQPALLLGLGPPTSTIHSSRYVVVSMYVCSTATGTTVDGRGTGSSRSATMADQGDFCLKSDQDKSQFQMLKCKKSNKIKAPSIYQLLKLILQDCPCFFRCFISWYLRLRFGLNNFWTKILKSSHSARSCPS